MPRALNKCAKLLKKAETVNAEKAYFSAAGARFAAAACTKTDIERNRVMIDAIQKATSDSRKISVVGFKRDPEAIQIQP